MARLLTRGRTVSMLWPRSSFSPLLHSTRIPRGTSVWQSASGHPHCLVQTTKNWPRIKQNKKLRSIRIVRGDTKSPDFSLGKFPDCLENFLFRLSGNFPDRLENVQIVWKLSRFSIKCSDCLETFQIV